MSSSSQPNVQLPLQGQPQNLTFKSCCDEIEVNLNKIVDNLENQQRHLYPLNQTIAATLPTNVNQATCTMSQTVSAAPISLPVKAPKSSETRATNTALSFGRQMQSTSGASSSASAFGTNLQQELLHQEPDQGFSFVERGRPVAEKQGGEKLPGEGGSSSKQEGHKGQKRAGAQTQGAEVFGIGTIQGQAKSQHTELGLETAGHGEPAVNIKIQNKGAQTTGSTVATEKESDAERAYLAPIKELGPHLLSFQEPDRLRLMKGKYYFVYYYMHYSLSSYKYYLLDDQVPCGLYFLTNI